MQNETFREIGYWGSIVAAFLGLINIIMCIVQVTKQGDADSVLSDSMDMCYGTVLYKITFAIVILAFLMMFISFMINVDGALKILMIICKILQALCIIIGIIGSVMVSIINKYMDFTTFFILVVLGCVIIECIALILYIIDRDHRKTIIRVFLFSIFTLGSVGLCFLVISMALLVAFFIFAISRIFSDTRPKDIMYDASGNIIGWIKRE